MYGIHSTAGYTEILEGVRIKTVVYGENTLMSEFIFTKGSIVREHSHPAEQTGYLVSGCIRLFINGEATTLKAGDSWNVPGNVPHKAEIIEDSLAVEVFSPVREEYLRYAREEDLRRSKAEN